MGRFQQFAACAVLLSGAAACKSVGVVGYPAEYVATHGPSHVWVTEPNHQTVDLYNPQVHGDTLVGFDKGAYTEIPLGDVQIMKANFPAPLRTALLAGGAAIGTAAVVAVLMGSGTTPYQASTCITPGTDFVTPCPNPNDPNGSVH